MSRHQLRKRIRKTSSRVRKVQKYISFCIYFIAMVIFHYQVAIDREYKKKSLSNHFAISLFSCRMVKSLLEPVTAQPMYCVASKSGMICPMTFCLLPLIWSIDSWQRWKFVQNIWPAFPLVHCIWQLSNWVSFKSIPRTWLPSHK